MSVNIEMPKLSDTMTEGTLIKWHKKIGDIVQIGDILAEVETDKATMEMEAFDDGIITDILIAEGEKAVIGGVIAILNGNSEHSSEPAITHSDATTTSHTTPEHKTIVSHGNVINSITSNRIKISPLARKEATETNIDISSIKGTGPAGRIVVNDIRFAASNSTPINKTSLEATAAAALMASIKTKSINPEQPLKSDTPAQITHQIISPKAYEGDERIELSSMRKIIASRLLISKTTIPHFYLHLEVDAEPLIAIRSQINAQAEKTHGNKYTLNDFIIKAVVNAATTVPTVNASFAGDHIIKFKHIGISVAIAVEDGLVTPVIKQAESKSLLEISRTVKDFAVRAKDKKLKPDEFDNGTITISNLGAWGIESFDAIVNPPQAAILSVGAALEKPVIKNGQVVLGIRMNLGLSCDHRVIDGAVAANFLSEIKKLIEQPALMLL